MNLLAVLLVASPLFGSAEPLDVRLEGPVAAVSRKAVERPFVLVHASHRHAVGVTVRGKSRRQFCTFPPLRIDFDRSATTGSVFEGQNKLKLVTHCGDRGADEANMLEEYFAYRIFNAVTDASFRTRLLRMTYVDTDSDRTTEKWAFLIEDVDDLAARLGGKHIEPPIVPPSRLDRDHAVEVALFQFLIGNTDYSVVAAPRGEPCCHNAKLIETPDALYSVPYDFDLSGLVDPKYTNVDTVQRRRSPRSRVYRGFCTEDAVLDRAIERYRALREEFDALLRAIPGLAARPTRIAARYVQGFFEILDESGAERFRKTCRVSSRQAPPDGHAPA